MRRSFPTPTPEPTAAESPTPKEELHIETPTVEIPAAETKKTPAKPAPPKATTRTKPVTEVEPRRSALAVEPVHAVEPRDSSARPAPTPPPDRPRLFQPASQATRSSSWTAADIRDLETRWQTAIKNHDVETVEKLLSDDLEATSVTGAKGGKKDILRALKNDKSVYKSVRAQNMTVTKPESDTAIVTGVATETGTTAEGTPFETSRRFTDTWKQRDGEWECVDKELPFQRFI
jgi:ketosteroid isomerase-like protein